MKDIMNASISCKRIRNFILQKVNVKMQTIILNALTTFLQIVIYDFQS